VPGNPARGLPTMIATLLLLDPATGVPLAVMDATWLTELRTAAVSAVATRALRDRSPKRLAILGSGALARSHALALAAVVPLSDIRVWSPNASQCRTLRRRYRRPCRTQRRSGGARRPTSWSP
jgi:ornithine cyclodeaminase/alanine dehydrogenase-like protein (mu-crystallin family)